MAPVQALAGNCSCISGVHDGQEPECLGGHGWPREAAVHGDKTKAGELALSGLVGPSGPCDQKLKRKPVMNVVVESCRNPADRPSDTFDQDVPA